MFDPHYAHIHEHLINWSAEYFKEDIQTVSQINATRYSYVLKINVQGNDYYLKHIPKKLFIESLISNHLRNNCGFKSVPEILASSEKLSCFITKSCGDKTLRQYFDGQLNTTLMLEGVALYKSIQRASVHHIEAYLIQGVADWRFSQFPALYEALLDDKACIDAWEIKSAQQAYLKQKKPIFEKLCSKIEALNIPDVLNHTDFQDNNIVIDTMSGNLSIIDWGEVSIGHPLLSLSSCLYGLSDRYKFTPQEYKELETMLFDGWDIPTQDFEDIRVIINILGQIYYVLAFQDLIKRIEYDFPNWKVRVQTALKVFAEEIENYSP